MADAEVVGIGAVEVFGAGVSVGPLYSRHRIAPKSYECLCSGKAQVLMLQLQVMPGSQAVLGKADSISLLLVLKLNAK